MILLSNHQHDVDWWSARCGKVSGSNVAAVMSFLKRGEKKESAERSAYRVKIVTEILTGQPVMGGFPSDAMKWGVEHEDLARAAYEMTSGNDVDLVGFALHDKIDRFGGSCDGLVGEDGIWEAKCPNTTTHVRWMLADVVPEEHEPQMSAYLSITGRAWSDFTSFDPRMPPHLRVFTKRLLRNEERIAEIEAGVELFLAQVDETIEKLHLTHPDTRAAKKRQQDATSDEGLGITSDDMPPWWKEMQARDTTEV